MDGVEFEATNNKRFCTERCAKRYENHMHRHGVPPVGPPTQPFNCEHCGKRCGPGNNVAAHASRFCGYHCKAAWHHHHVEGQPRRPAEQMVWVGRDRRAIATWRALCGELALAEWGLTVKSYDVTAYKRSLRADPCAYCGADAEALDHIEPKDNGGEDGWANRTAACRRCNSYKGTKSLLEALLWIPVATEYHDLRRVLH